MKVQANGDLYVCGIDADEEVSLLQEIMMVDTIYEDGSESIDHYLVSPNRNQLLEFIRKGGFSEEGLFLKKIP